MKRTDEIKENRLWNLRQLVEASGGINAAARIIGRHNSQLTDLCGPNPKRSIGDRVAAAIEAAFELPPGALDHPPPKETKAGNPFLSRIAATLANVPDEDKDFVLSIAQWIAHRNARKLATVSDQGNIDLSDVAEDVEQSSLQIPQGDVTFLVDVQQPTSSKKQQRKKSNAIATEQ